MKEVNFHAGETVKKFQAEVEACVVKDVNGRPLLITYLYTSGNIGNFWS